jgi:hypothetical protein
MPKIDKIDYKILSSNEIKNISDFFYGQYTECQIMGYNRGMNMNKQPCKFLFNEYLKYKYACEDKKKEDK